jgi:Uma2 family endonuclease
MPPLPTRKTIADLDALPPGARAELIDGVVYERPVTTLDHARIAFRIAMRIALAYEDGVGGPGGWWIAPEVEFAAEGRDVFRPDVAGWRKERLPDPPRDRRVEIVPDWACEVISESNREHDEIVKRAAYARIGVAHWWLVDPAARSLTAHVLEGGTWRVIARLEGAVVAPVAPFDEAGLDMAEWWR